LVVYTAAFIAEIVRAGILAVPLGQFEAAYALGLRRRRAMRLVVLPQALRAIVPPLTGQYLNLTKNSSLAVAIGYPDLVSIANTTINQTGQAIEGVAIIMAVYLAISLSISALMNWYNARMALRER
jgi:general L-amino acid transport system permease protein